MRLSEQEPKVLPQAAWDVPKRTDWYFFAGDGLKIAVQPEVRDGKTVLVGIHIETTEEPLSTSTLRSIPLGALLSRVARAGRFWDGEESLRPVAVNGPIPLEALVGDRLPIPKRPGRKGHSEETYRKAAQVWSEALRTHPRSPMKETAARLGYSVAQTRRLVDGARSRRLIEEDIIR